MRRSKRPSLNGLFGVPLFLLLPGLSLKRWLVLGVLGAAVIALGIAFAIQVPVGPRFFSLIGMASLREAPAVVRGGVFVGIGLAIGAFAAYRLSKSLSGVRSRRHNVGIIDSLYVERVLGAGPRVVAIGGGTGLSRLLRGLKLYTRNITAVVTVADDGGSSGRLRSEMGIPPPGDIRNCLVALADSEDVMQQLMDYRFSTNGDLDGHSFGNMLIAVLAGVGGSFDKGVEMAGELLAIRGKVIPSTPDNVTLVAKTVSGQRLVGESMVGTATARLEEVALFPPKVRAHPEAIKAIESADLIILGPGSVFTSIVPNLLVSEIAQAIANSGALKVYVSNVAEQAGETEGLSALDCLNVIRRYGGNECVDVVIANDNLLQGREPIHVRLVAPGEHWDDATIYARADVIDEANPSHHDPMKLAAMIAATYRRHRSIRPRARMHWRRSR